MKKKKELIMSGKFVCLFAGLLGFICIFSAGDYTQDLDHSVQHSIIELDSPPSAVVFVTINKTY